jgi:hypothetical protein
MDERDRKTIVEALKYIDQTLKLHERVLKTLSRRIDLLEEIIKQNVIVYPNPRRL